MIFFKKLLSFLFIVIVTVSAGFLVFKKAHPELRNYIPTAKPCSIPLKYSIGNIDPQFEISQGQLKKIISEAAGVWDKASGLDLFQYDPNATLKVQMVYDERQQETNAAESLEASLKALNTTKVTLDKQYDGLVTKYKQKLGAFKAGIADYEKKLQSYNKNVDYWNSRGGAPADEYNQLKKDKQALDEKLSSLKKQQSDLNGLSGQINSLAAQENKIVSNYNKAVKTFQNEYGSAQEFEKGIFDSGQGIIIYQFKEEDDLRLTLVHELGHALGMDHVENPKSIMYYLMGEQDLNNPTLTAEDMAELKSVCQL